MKQYQDLLRTVLAEGEWQENRTGIRTLSYPGASMRFDLAQGFPALTLRKLAFKSSVAEMLGFIRGYTSAADFRALGSKVWDQNANENADWLANPWRKGEDDLGRVYGVQWRDWQAFKLGDALRENAPDESWEYVDWVHLAGADRCGSLYHKTIDQFAECVRKIMETPQDRRIIFHGWNPGELDQMALPPCHLLYQFHPNVTQNTLSLTVYVRSNDLGLGAPFNICGAAVLLSLMARVTGYTPKILTIQIGDAHIYENHLEMVEEMLRREPLPAPTLRIAPICEKAPSWKEAVVMMEKVVVLDFFLEDYNHHDPINAPMAV